MQARRNLFSRFIKCDRGVTALEFAFVSPVLLLFIFGILEFSMIFMAGNVLENAVNNAARTGKTGYITSGISREQTILSAIESRVDMFMDPHQITINTRTYKAINEVGKPEPFTDRDGNGVYDLGEPYTDSNGNGEWDSDMASSGFGTGGEVVVYDVSYPWQIMTPFLSNILGQDTINLSTHVLVKNEPYTDSNT